MQSECMLFTDLSTVITHTANAFQLKTTTPSVVSYYIEDTIMEANAVLPIIRK